MAAGAVGVVVVAAVWLTQRAPPGSDGTGATTGRDRPGRATTRPAEETTAPTSSPPAAPPGPADQATLDGLALRLEPVVALQHPTALVQHPVSRDIYAAGLEGHIVRLPAGSGDPVPVADLGRWLSTSGESGLLDLAFDVTGGLMYLSLVETDGDLALLELPVVDSALRLDRQRLLLSIPSPSNVHHAGDVDVDAQGLLWLAVGDGGPSQGSSRRAQDLGDLHGKVLRIDPRPTPTAAYQVPPDNPFVGQPGARPEVWAYGLRNPWRIDVDRTTGDLWVGDVGRNGAEEINHAPGPNGGAGINFGWPHREGTAPVVDGEPPGLVPPLLEYPHEGRCGITGGAVYRGSAIPELDGAYLYSDLCDGVVRAVTVADGTVRAQRAFDDAQAGYPVAFGTDLAGEMYLCSFDLGTVYRILTA